MIWLRDKTGRIQPTLDSLRHTFSQQQQQRADTQQDLQVHRTHWKVLGSVISLIIFTVLLTATVIGVPIILTKMKKASICVETTPAMVVPTSSVQPSTVASLRAGGIVKVCSNSSSVMNFEFEGTKRLCTVNAVWNRTGVTVAGLSNGLPSTSLAGLQYPQDIYVYDDGTILVADSDNNRIMKWSRGAKEGVLIAGTGAYGSWNNLLAKPIALTVRGDQLYVSDSENYRVQVFPLNSNFSSPDAVTLIGRYGQGLDLNQINQITSLIAPTLYPSLLYMADSKNHRILSWNSENNRATVITGQTGVSGSDSTLLYNPLGVTLDTKSNSLYIADSYNNRIQKYDMNKLDSAVTVAGWGQLNHPNAVQLDPFGTDIFIADTLDHRILVWSHGTSEGRFLLGDGTAGNGATQLNSPSQIRFDSNHNLYVVDTNNCRIQRFDRISNGC